MNKYQIALKAAMNETDALSEKRGVFAQRLVNFRGQSMGKYLDSSPKWESCHRGWMTVDGQWVIRTGTGSGYWNLVIGRNY